jgi:hypothetical protein
MSAVTGFPRQLLIPKTKRGNRTSTQIYSTMHKAYGLMVRVIEEAALSG